MCVPTPRFYSEAPEDSEVENTAANVSASHGIFQKLFLDLRVITARFATALTSQLRQPMTMLRLKSTQRRVLADKLPDAANVVLAGFVVGQALSERPFSLALALIGMSVWARFIAFAMLFAPEDQP